MGKKRAKNDGKRAPRFFNAPNLYGFYKAHRNHREPTLDKSKAYE
jgi:hypothetical protein